MAVAIDNGSIQKHIKPHFDDSAILFYSSSSNMTRYDKADLITLKDGKMSQQPPECYYNPEIMRLNILKYQNNHTREIEDQMKVFREKLQNLTLASWDPNLLQLLRNYHNALLNPFYNSYAANFQPVPNPANQQFSSPQQVSFAEKQQSVLDKIPSYDRNMNFFDNITTTATMRPPRMGVNSFNNNHHNGSNYYKRPNQYNNNLRKPNSCANEYANSYSSSVGYFSGNDTKSSCEESLLDKPCEKRATFDFNKNNKMDSNVIDKKIGEEEKEPEWFSVPATLEDFIDLHGFDDEEGNNVEPKEANEQHIDDGQKNPINNSFQNNDYQQNQNRRYNPNNSYNRYANNNNNNFNGYNNNRNMSYRPNYPAQNYNAMNNGNQRFRNPLHFQKPQRTSTAPIVNPFFDAWRNGKFMNHRNVSFTEMMEQNGYPRNMPTNAVHMSEIENQMKQFQNCNYINQQSLAQAAAVPQFFQNLANNWGVRVNENSINAYQPQNIGPPPPPIREGYQMPTQEQLQQFTSEIMRNAILRKNQQYHDENNYQK